MEINSKAYWEDRFQNGSWDKFDGSKQTMSFADLIINNLPEWLNSALSNGSLSLLDAGCAKGELVHALKKKFSSCELTGIDFSESAVRYASETYKNCNFECNDIATIKKDYDIIFSSNTLEHFKNPSDILKGFFAHAKSHVVLLLPFEEYELSAEHLSFFDLKSFPLISDDFILTYYKILAPSATWNGKQIILVFTKLETAKSFSLNNTYTAFWKEIENLKNECNEKIASLSLLLKEAEAEIDILSTKVTTLTNDKASLDDELANVLGVITSAQTEVANLALTKSFKAIHLISRIKHQFLKGDKNDKKAFLTWLKTRSSRTDTVHRYNPAFNVVNILNEAKKSVTQNPVFKGAYEFKNGYNKLKADYFDAVSGPFTKDALKMRDILASRSYKGIIVYPHIIHWSNMQTPQHLLRCFAKDGYLCLFAEHNFTETELTEVEPNLFVLCEKDLIQSIFDKSVIVFCTWMCSMGWIEQLKDKVLWYHILDKIDIFANYDKDYKEKHNEVIQSADLITYVAHELKRYIPEGIKGYYLPNGTNVSDFMNIHENFVPDDMKQILKSGKKIVGYYGLISHWFDMDMMEKLADRNPDINFVFIGDYVVPKPLPEKENMFFMGKKPYKELSDYAKFFNCAIIPFEISDMMDCVSPIKFFEYRALGLPVVSSYMKEMEQYKSDCVLVAHDIDSFEKAIFKTFEPEIKQLAKDTGLDFALSQQWSIRAKELQEHFEQLKAEK